MSSFLEKLKLYRPKHKMKMHTDHKCPEEVIKRQNVTKAKLKENMIKNLDFVRQESYYTDIILRIHKCLN